MRIIGLVMLLAISAVAEVPPAVAPFACGSGNVTFNVKLDESQHALAQPEAGKALVYFVQEKGADNQTERFNIPLGALPVSMSASAIRR
jgi:hypothetical protein